MTVSSPATKASSHRNLVPLPARIVLALFYIAAILAAAQNILLARLAESNAENIFASPAEAMIFVRLITAGVVLIFTLLQAVIFGLLFALVTGTKRPRLGEGWGYILLAQIPFTLTVFFLYLRGGFDAAAYVQAQWVHHVNGLLTVLVYTFFMARGKNIQGSKLIAFSILTLVANSALMLLSSGNSL